MKYQVQQKIFTLTDSFDIYDERQQLVMKVQGKVFSFSSSQTMRDAAGKQVLQIKRKYLTLLPACRLLCADGSEWLVRKRFWPFWRSRFTVQTPYGEFEVQGNFWQYEYQIVQKNSQQDKLLAQVSKAWFSLSDRYGVDILAPEWTAQLLGIVIVIDRIAHSGRNSQMSDD